MECSILDPTISTTQTGYSLRKLIQNSTDPILDLFVRESLQNSLDAGDDSDAKFVIAEYIIGRFNRAKVNSVLNMITEKLDYLYPDDYYTFIAIKDTNTTGLKGPLRADQVRDNISGNLRNLVYNICRPQEMPGCGGCWGIGKTVYFRMTKRGLVFYYSRTINNEGEYESRLCAALVEDETQEDAILPACDDNNNRSGIGWWGINGKKDQSYPIIDEILIKEILSYFDIEPFAEDQTGTMVIIPYINEQELLQHNQDSTGLPDDSIQNVPWSDNLEEYLRICVQRWYACRLDNPYYYNRSADGRIFKYLRAFVNGKEIRSSEMEPIFRVYQDLYNTCIYKIYNKADNPIVSTQNIECKAIDYWNSTAFLGHFAYVKLDKSQLCNILNVHPKSYIWSTSSLSLKPGENLPLLSMTRKPGMMVEYNSQAWISFDNIPKTQGNDFILGLFVLNSKSKLTEEYNLEEYFRKGGENADHMGWHDHSNLGTKGKYVGNIFSKTLEALRASYSVEEDNANKQKPLSAGALLGRIFQINGLKKKNSGTGDRKDHEKKTKNAKLDGVIISYQEDSIIVKIGIKSVKKTTGTNVLFKVDSDSSPVTAEKWVEDTRLLWPFPIEKCILSMTSFDSMQCEECFDVIEQPEALSYFSVNHQVANDGSIYGINISTKDQEKHAFVFSIELTLRLVRNDVKPLLQID